MLTSNTGGEPCDFSHVSGSLATVHWGPLSSSGKQQGGAETFIFPFSSPVQSSGLSVACHSLSRAPSIDFSAPLLSPSHHSLSRPGPWETDIGRVSICFLHLWHVLRSLISFALSAASESCDPPPPPPLPLPISPPNPPLLPKTAAWHLKVKTHLVVFCGWIKSLKINNCRIRIHVYSMSVANLDFFLT